jgi:hypothetical protein
MLRNGYALIVSAPATQVPGVLYWIVAARTAARIPAREPLHRRLVRGLGHHRRHLRPAGQRAHRRAG